MSGRIPGFFDSPSWLGRKTPAIHGRRPPGLQAMQRRHDSGNGNGNGKARARARARAKAAEAESPVADQA